MPHACGILIPGPGIEPMFPALAGRFLTTGPPGKTPSFLKNKTRSNFSSLQEHCAQDRPCCTCPGVHQTSMCPDLGFRKHPLKPETEAAPASPSAIYPWAPGSHGIKRILWTHFLLGSCQDASHQGFWVSCLIAASPDPPSCPPAPTPAPGLGLAPLQGHSAPTAPCRRPW